MAGSTDSETQRLDLRGLKCPLPAMRTRGALARLPPGRRLVVETTDPLSAIDVPHAIASAGGKLIAHRRDGAVHIFEIVRND